VDWHSPFASANPQSDVVKIASGRVFPKKAK
jgi:hypothetical protein